MHAKSSSPGAARKPRKTHSFSKGDIVVAKTVFESRSKRSREQDLVRLAKISPNISVYVKSPNRFDIPGVDTVQPALLFSRRSKRSRVADLAKLARRAPLQLWIGNINRYDLEGVDTPPKDKHVRRFKILSRKDAKKEKPIETRVRTLPTKEEILERAKEKFMDEQSRRGLPAITPEESELKESGLFEVARSELMRSDKTKADSQILQYIGELRNELEQFGFTVVPLE
jgi:hypothetical protein